VPPAGGRSSETLRRLSDGSLKTLKSVAPHLEDEFGPYLEAALEDPAFRAAFEDEGERHRILDSLVSLRRDRGMSQSAVARQMGVRQPTVSGFETEGSDPRLSTLQRYARAVGARLRLTCTVPSECDWVSPSTLTYRGSATASNDASIDRSELVRDWRREESTPTAYGFTA
jgi:transcriptional regulator with XRE-family HTH domain